ncbi:MAG: hypothetical protein AAGF11_56735 [Myxococcota bacterium]
MGTTVQPCAGETADTWIELEVVDCQGEPLAEEEYVVISPGRARRRGVTDDRGRARIEHVESGSCQVWLPRREPEDYCGAPSFVEIRLLDEDGRTPRAGERFVARFENGERTQGTLDANGTVRLDGVHEGTCALSFPDLGDDWGPA